MSECLVNVLARLDKVKKHPGQAPYWTALCPAHDDHHPSLSVRLGDDGRVLVKCHAQKGCTFPRIAFALGLEAAAFFPNGVRTERKIVKAYVYEDERGRKLYQVVRFEPKSFGVRRYEADPSEPWKASLAWGLGNVRPVLYNLPAVLASAARDETVYVVEGEKDARALVKLGLTATTSPFGAGKWEDRYGRWLKNRRVLVVPDNDGPGRDHALHVMGLLRQETARCLLAPLPLLGEDFKDVSDMLDKCPWMRGPQAAASLTTAAIQHAMRQVHELQWAMAAFGSGS